ncbi:hypothetical protein [Actinotalea sp.]|uniref:hypothetical protein n=1 Tax=Actinotalea sp. TaxID=1872145 RepID=UPI00356A926F
MTAAHRSRWRRSPAPDPAPVLELRVHGVNNTAPPEALDLAPADVERVAGDALGSFWRPSAAARERMVPGERGHVPDGVVREAYSWGGLARTSVGGHGGLGAVVGAASRVGWALLVPFGLVNLAFWSRRLAGGRAWAGGWQDDASAAALRVFSLTLTLLLLGTTSVVSLDLVMAQCFAGGARWCARLPSVLDGLAGLGAGQRLVIGALAPVAVLVLLAALAGATRSRYEQLAALPEGYGVRAAPADAPALATPGFWSNARLTALLGRVHIAAGLCFLVVITAAPQVGDGGAVVFTVTLAGGGAGLLAITLWLASRRCAVAAQPGTPGGRRLARTVTRVTVASVLLFTVHLVLLATVPGVRARAAGLVVAPTVMTLLLLVLTATALWWRRGADRRYEAWGGRAPAVFLVLALGAALTLSSMVVVGVGDWLNGSRSAGELLHAPLTVPGTVPAPDRTGCDAACPVVEPALTIPGVYVWFGAAIGIAVLLVLLVGAVAALRTSRSLPRAASTGSTPSAGPDHLGPGVQDRPGAGDAVLRSRWAAAVAHRAEPLTGVLAVASAVSVVLALGVTVLVALRPDLGPPQVDGSVPAGWAEQLYAAIAGGAAWGAGGVGLLVLIGLVGGAAVGRSRPLGLVWDLMCFLPRTGHPFGPPCYAERVVPELVRRYATWIGPIPAGSRRAPSSARVVISAHSLGAVLAVASIFATRVEHGPRVTARLSLLTHGCQLRAYFGRMFPELLGPEVLGTPPSVGAGLLTADPWRDALVHDAGHVAARQPGEGALTGLLTSPDGEVRWLSLWRRTDYLGFPVSSFVGGPLDRSAEEIDTSGYLPQIGTHGGYPRVPAYAAAFEHLLRTP